MARCWFQGRAWEVSGIQFVDTGMPVAEITQSQTKHSNMNSCVETRIRANNFQIIRPEEMVEVANSDHYKIAQLILQYTAVRIIKQFGCVNVICLKMVLHLNWSVHISVPYRNEIHASERACSYILWRILHAELMSSCQVGRIGRRIGDPARLLVEKCVTFLFCIPRGLYAIMSGVSGTGGGGTMDCAR